MSIAGAIAYNFRCKHTATHCNTLQHTATHCNTLQHTAMAALGMSTAGAIAYGCRCKHTAPPCTTLHHTAPHCIGGLRYVYRRRHSIWLQLQTHCNTLATHATPLQHPATNYMRPLECLPQAPLRIATAANTLQHTATLCTHCIGGHGNIYHRRLSIWLQLHMLKNEPCNSCIL